MNLNCAVCLLVVPDDPLQAPDWLPLPRLAVTIANGHATCQQHLPYVQGWPDIDDAVTIAKRNRV